jgi:hypothetical protein
MPYISNESGGKQLFWQHHIVHLSHRGNRTYWTFSFDCPPLTLSLSLVWQFVWKQFEYPTLSQYQGNRWLSLVHRGSRKLCDMVVISCLVYIQKQIAIKLFEQFVQEEEERYQLNKVVWHLNHS